MSHCCINICDVAPSSLSNSWLDTSGFRKESSPAGFLDKQQGHNQPMDTPVTGRGGLAMVCAWKRMLQSNAYLSILICKICNSKTMQQNHTLQHLLVWSNYQIPSNKVTGCINSSFWSTGSEGEGQAHRVISEEGKQVGSKPWYQAMRTKVFFKIL